MAFHKVLEQGAHGKQQILAADDPGVEVRQMLIITAAVIACSGF